MSTTTTEKKKKVYKTSDDVLIEVDESYVKTSQVSMWVSKYSARVDDPIDLPDVSSAILEKVIQYCQKHAVVDSGGTGKDDLRKWDEAFIDVDQLTLFEIALAASVLGVDDLLHLAYAKAL